MIIKMSMRLFFKTKTNRRGSALMELAIFGSIALAALGFFIRTLATEFGAIRAAQEAFRLCLYHAGEDNDNFPYESRAVGGYLQIAVPSVSVGSWDLSVSDAARGCYAEWGKYLTMGVAQGACNGKGTARFFGAGSNSTFFPHSAACGRGPLDTRSTISNISKSTTDQTTIGGTTHGTALVDFNGTVSTTMISGSISSGVSTGGATGPAIVEGSTSAP